ncbi:MAG: energy transducer TonB [Saprospiraceae bacterium]|nr:energy transducer TonB [Saprospiraceae bacterium]
MKTTTIALFLLFSFSLKSFAQSQPLLTPKELESGNYQTLTAYLMPTDEAYPEIEDNPMYPGGEAGLMQDLGKNIKYPKKARKQGITGQVVLTFVIEKDGSIGPVEIKKSVHPDIDAVAVNAVKQLKRFYPAKAGGVPLRVRYTLPLRFALE